VTEGDAFSLDFTLPSAPPEKPAAPASTKAPEVSPTTPSFRMELVDVDAPAVTLPAAQPAPTPAAKSRRAPPPAALLEAAILHAEGKALEAVRRLEAALKARENLGDVAVRVWAGLFDLLQALGRRPAFESLAIAFAKRFEKSPPTWVETPPIEAIASNTVDADGVALKGALTSAVADALKQATKLAQTRPEVTINLAGLTSADNDGATLLMRVVSGLKKAGKRLIFASPDHLAGLLAPALVSGERKNEAMWLLLLELYQQAGQQDAYEEAALNYAVTFEVSPPAWVPPATTGKKLGKPAIPPTRDALVAVPALSIKADEFSLRGQLLNTPAEEFAGLNALMAERDALEIDARDVTRINATAAANLLAALTRVSAGGKKISLTQLAPLVATYLEHLGFSEVIELRIRAI